MLMNAGPKRYLALLLILCGFLAAPPGWAGEAVRLKGSGASFPFPLYGAWFKEYGKAHRHVIIDYQAKGSGAGVRDFINKTVDFAASDAAMTDAEMQEVDVGVQLLPMTAGAIVLSYNLPGGVKELKLSREAYSKIFLGQVKKWSDPLIAQANPDAKMPDLDITVARRADASGTTFVFTQHLSTISEAWSTAHGTGTTVNWPSSDKFIASPQNAGVAATIKQTPGAIGYIEYGYAEQGKLLMASLENKAGTFVKPTLESGQAALAGVELPPDLRVWLPDPSGQEAYPIVTYTWMLFYKKYDDTQKAQTIRDVVQYCLTDGQKMSTKLGYIPLPPEVVQGVSQAAQNIQSK
jgi:phosphate transport system substrate-binding protein